MGNVEDRLKGIKAKISISDVDSTSLTNALNGFFLVSRNDFSVKIKDVLSSLHPVQREEVCQENVVELF